MALINCPECQKEISDTTNTCVHCGYILIKNKTLIEKLKERKKILFSISAVVIVAIIGITLFASGIIGVSSSERIALRDIKTLQKTLLDPNSIILYEVYYNPEYPKESPSTLIHYGAKNKGGGITDDWALVTDKNIESENEYDKAVKADDSYKILAHANVIWCKAFGLSDDWKEIDVDKLHRRIK